MNNINERLDNLKLVGQQHLRVVQQRAGDHQPSYWKVRDSAMR